MHPSRRDNDLWWWFYLETRNSGSVLCSQLTSSAPQFTTLSRLYSFDDVILHVLHPDRVLLFIVSLACDVLWNEMTVETKWGPQGTTFHSIFPLSASFMIMELKNPLQVAAQHV